jgi:hypothetical protein
MTWWSPDAPAARITGDGVELHPSHADDVHLAALSEAHGVQGGRGNAQLADDILAKVWPSLRPPGGAVAAAEAAAAAAIAASAVSLRGARGVKGPRRIPRIRI